MPRVEHQWQTRELLPPNAPAPAQWMPSRERDHDGFGCDLQAPHAWDVLEGRQHKRHVELGSSQPLDILFGAARLGDDFHTWVSLPELGRQALRESPRHRPELTQPETPAATLRKRPRDFGSVVRLLYDGFRLGQERRSLGGQSD